MGEACRVHAVRLPERHPGTSFNTSTNTMSKNFQGASVNGSGTRIAAAKAFGSAGAVATANAARDVDTLVPNGNQLLTIKAAINHGILQRDSSGTLVELNGPTTPTRVNS